MLLCALVLVYVEAGATKEQPRDVSLSQDWVGVRLGPFVVAATAWLVPRRSVMATEIIHCSRYPGRDGQMRVLRIGWILVGFERKIP